VGRNRFLNYGLRAQHPTGFTEMSGRYRGQAFAERLIVPDVISKLDIQPEDQLLDIGCGVGLLLLPLSFLVEGSVGIDHPDVIEVVRRRAGGDEIELVGANFLDVELSPRRFDKILIYGVVQYLETEEELLAFLAKAVNLLSPGGRMLIGDIPNADRKSRFLDSDFGKAFTREWAKNSGNAPSGGSASIEMFPPDPIVEFTDELVCRLLLFVRQMGLDAFVMPQPPELPFGFTREDMVIVAPR